MSSGERPHHPFCVMHSDVLCHYCIIYQLLFGDSSTNKVQITIITSLMEFHELFSICSTIYTKFCKALMLLNWLLKSPNAFNYSIFNNLKQGNLLLISMTFNNKSKGVVLVSSRCNHCNAYYISCFNLNRRANQILNWNDNEIIKGILWDRRWSTPSIRISPHTGHTCWFFYGNTFLIMKLSKLPSFRAIRALIASQSTFEI